MLAPALLSLQGLLTIPVHRALSKYWFRHGCREHEAACSSKKQPGQSSFPQAAPSWPSCSSKNSLAKETLYQSWTFLSLLQHPKGCSGPEHREFWPVTESTWIIPKIKQCGAHRAGRNPPLPLVGLWLALRVNWFPSLQGVSVG